MDFVFLGLMIISLIGLITCKILKIGIAVVFLKILTSFLFVILGAISYKKGKSNKKYSLFIILGLIFSMFGDTFLAIDKNQSICFYLGVVAFVIAHIMYITGFSNCTKLTLRDFIVFLLIFTPIILIMVIGKFDFHGMFPVLVFYAIIICFMVSKALSLTKYYNDNKKAVIMTIAGAVMFLISDIILLFILFYTKEYMLLRSETNWIVYYPGQAILAMSLKQNIQFQKR
ncbi:MAG: lysoplasmalogenase [Clostridium sp.]|nr:lysoplasmalogenase [Clostridium sp.]